MKQTTKLIVVFFVISSVFPLIHSQLSSEMLEEKKDAQSNPPIYITHGPVLGRPGSDQMGVWARTSSPGEFRILYGQSRDIYKFSSPPIATTHSNDNTGWILLKALKPETTYYYAVVMGDEIPMTKNKGSFRTLPDAAYYKNNEHNPKGLFNFAFEVGCGNAQNEAYSIGPEAITFATMHRLLKDKIQFAIQTGDFIYEDQRDFSANDWHKEQDLSEEERPNILRIAPTITGVWENYKIYLERSNHLAAWHRHVPSYFMFDDHEILNDVMGCSVPGYRSRPACFRDIGIRAWYDYVGWSNPVLFDQDILFSRANLKNKSNILEDKNADFTTLDLSQAATLTVHWGTETAGVWDPQLDRADKGDPNAGVYEIVEIVDKHHLRINPETKTNSVSSYSIGRRNYFKFRVGNCEFYVLDTRSHRGIPALDQKRIKEQTMLGLKQKQWLMNNMAESKADFLFVVSTVNFMIPHTGKGGYVETAFRTDESWTGFLNEREELLDFWQTINKPVILLSGDLHNAFAIQITKNIWEFTASPHASGNHNLHSEAGRPINGNYSSGGRNCDIRWSTFFLDDIERFNRRQPVYTVVQVNNVFNNALTPKVQRWVAYSHPQVVIQFYDGFTGNLLYAESLVAKND